MKAIKRIAIFLIVIAVFSMWMRIDIEDWINLATKNGEVYSYSEIEYIKDESYQEGYDEGYSEGYYVGGDDGYEQGLNDSGYNSVDVDPIYYYVPNGHSYHSSPDCITLRRSKDIRSAHLSQLYGRDPCDLCVPNSGSY